MSEKGEETHLYNFRGIGALAVKVSAEFRAKDDKEAIEKLENLKITDIKFDLGDPFIFDTVEAVEVERLEDLYEERDVKLPTDSEAEIFRIFPRKS